MDLHPMAFSGTAMVRRDALSIAIGKFYQWSKDVDLRASEVMGYGTQTYQGSIQERLFWFHEITLLVVTDRAIPWVQSISQLVEKWKETDAYAKENELTYANEQKPPPPLPIVPRTEEQDRFNVQNQNNRAAKMGARGTFTYEEWMILRQHFGEICGRCKNPLARPVIDHVIPLSRGGTNYIENIQTLCKDCNSGKGARPADYRDPELVLSFLEKLDEFRNVS